MLNTVKSDLSRGRQFAFFWNRALEPAGIGDTHKIGPWSQLRTPIKIALNSLRSNEIRSLVAVPNIPLGTLPRQDGLAAPRMRVCVLFLTIVRTAGILDYMNAELQINRNWWWLSRKEWVAG